MSTIISNTINQDIETLYIYLKKTWAFKSNQRIKNQIDLNDVDQIHRIVHRCIQAQTQPLPTEDRSLINMTLKKVIIASELSLSDLALASLLEKSNNYMELLATKIQSMLQLLVLDRLEQRYTLQFSDHKLTISESVMHFLKRHSPFFQTAFSHEMKKEGLSKKKPLPLQIMTRDTFLNTFSIFYQRKMDLTPTDLEDINTFLNTIRSFHECSNFFLLPLQKTKKIVDSALTQLANVLTMKYDHLREKLLNEGLSVFEPREDFPEANEALDNMTIRWFLYQIKKGRNFLPSNEIRFRVQTIYLRKTVKISENKSKRLFFIFSNCIKINLAVKDKLIEFANSSLYNEITKLKGLQILYLSDYKRFTNKDITQITQLQSLNSLSLSNCPDLTDDALSPLTELPNLHTLSLSKCNKLTNDALLYVIQLTRLQKLVLTYDKQLSDQALSDVTRLQNLHELNFSWNDTLTTIGVAYITKLQNIRLLNISGRDLSDTSIALLTNFTNLESLNISYNDELTDQCLIHLVGLEKLRFINLNGCNFTKEAVKKIQKPTLEITSEHKLKIEN